MGSVITCTVPTAPIIVQKSRKRASKIVDEASRDLFGHRTHKTRVLRTSNGYAFIDPQPLFT